MEIKVTATAPDKQTNACLILPLHSGKKLNGKTAKINERSENAITRAVKRGDASADIGKTLTLHELNNISSDRVLLVGAGEAGKASRTEFRKMCSSIASALRDSGANMMIIHFEKTWFAAEEDAAWHAQTLAQSLIDSQYKFTRHSDKKGKTARKKKCFIVVAKNDVRSCIQAVKHGVAIANGQALARDLGNLAPNICTPLYLAKEAQALAKSNANLSTKILTEVQMAKLGMNAFLSVSRGSRQDARLICMEYRGADTRKKPTVLLGKGITFDTGGISIKPSASMDEMKFDMCGAASVFGAMRAICELKPKSNIIGVVAAAENMPDGDASRPGDVVKSMSGQSVEILNTDAEGRLVLSDSLTYIERYKPAAVIDVATLTGAAVVALGKVCSAIMSNDNKLADALYKAGQVTGDLAWELPLWEEYQSQLDSNFADMANIGGSPAGAITAGCFLSRFAKNYNWAHLDIAGVAWKGGKEKGATGRPVPLLMEYILNNA